MSSSALANLVLFFPLAVTIFIASRISAGWAVSNHRSRLGSAIVTVIKLMLVFAVVGLCCRNSITSTIWLLLAGGSLTLIAIKNRELKRSAFMLTLFHCAHDAEQVHSIAASFHEENTGWLKRRCRRLLRALPRVNNWGRAVEIANLVRGPRNILALRVLCQLGKPGLVRRTMMRGESLESLIDTLLGRLFTLFGFIFGFIILVLLEVYIVPTFERLLQEMQVPVPSNFLWFTQNQLLINCLLATVALLATLIACVIFCLYLFPNTRTFGPQRLIFRSYFRALSFEALAETSQGDANLVQAIEQVASVHPIPAESVKMLQAARNVTAGMNTGAAFLKARMANRSEAAMLDMSLNQRSLAGMFSQLGRHRLDRCLDWYAALVQLSLIAIILAMATLVGLMAYSVLEVLVLMIERLT